jgi:type I polyketide synthase PikAIV
VDWSAGKVELLAEARPWEPDGHPRRAGVSSFGASGTNAHLILEEPPAVEGEGPRESDGEESELGDRIAPLLLSAKDEGALREVAIRLRTHLLEHPQQSVAEVARSLAGTRPRLDRRAAVAGRDREELLEGLAAVAGDREADNAFVAAAPAPVAADPVFLFPGQGSQWRGMAVELLRSSPRFARAIDDCEQALEPHLDWSLGALLRREDGAADLERIDVVQPALFAMSVALAALWRAHGVEPAAVVGHSQGEIAAAHVAGGLSLEDAARLIALRSRVLVQGTGEGAMALVAASPDDLSARVPSWPELVSLAGINGPSLIVLSGSNEGIDETLGLCEEAGVWTRRIRAAVGAGHSPAVERGREQLLEAAAGISPRPGEVPFHSAVMAGPLDTAELDAEYWYRNAREPVLFGPTVALLLAAGHRHFVEVSPNPILMVPMHESFSHELGSAATEATFTPSLRHRHGGLHDFGLAVGSAWASGVEVDLDAALPPTRRSVALPTYPFQRQHYWLSSSPASEGRGSPETAKHIEDDDDGSLVAQLASVPEGARRDAVLEFVLRELAAALGYESHAELDPARPFLELGFDSLTALQYRNRLNRATGLDLAVSVALDHPSPEALAEHLLSLLEVSDSVRAGAGAATLQSLLRNALELGRAAEFTDLLAGLAGFRPSFATPEEADAEPVAVRLAEGSARPPLLCLPSIMPNGGPHEYARLAAALRDPRAVDALHWPGFTVMEPVPASSSAAVAFQVAAIERAGAEPVVLLGHSSGGAFAYAIAQHLERQGTPPAGVVLVDSYHPSQTALETATAGPAGLAIFSQLLAAGGPAASVSDTRLTAAMSYLRLLGGIEIEPLATPVLLLRAAEPLAADPAVADWRPHWEVPHDVLETPGNHLTMMDAHAETTAEAISGWLAGAVDVGHRQASKRREVHT